jgi:hypothetical protein
LNAWTESSLYAMHLSWGTSTQMRSLSPESLRH